MFKIFTVNNFDKEFKKLLKKYPSLLTDLKKLIKELEEDPYQGILLGKDCYKIRMAIASKNKGKSGGSRVITCVKISKETVTLLSIYDKSEQNDISDSFLIQLLKDNQLI